MKSCFVVTVWGRGWEDVEAADNDNIYGRKVTSHPSKDILYPGSISLFFNDTNIHNNTPYFKNTIGIIARARLIDYRGLHGMMESGYNFS